MAKMRINIENPTIDLIANVKPISNDEKTVYLFDILTTPQATINVVLQRMNSNVEDYQSAEIQPENGVWQAAGGQITLPTGKAQFKLTIGNANLVVIKNGTGSCNETTVTIEDQTNTLSESRLFGRCQTGN